MPNIYLRLPYSRCQFFRYRDPNHVLEKHEPLVFNMYMPEHVAMLCSLTNAQSLTHCVNSQCFSHQQWRNMLSGRSPLGGNVIIRRDSNEYLTFAEVQQLSGKVEYNKSENEDYLCIKLPNEVEVVDVVRPVTSSWNLDTHGIRKMVFFSTTPSSGAWSNGLCLRSTFAPRKAGWSAVAKRLCLSVISCAMA